MTELAITLTVAVPYLAVAAVVVGELLARAVAERGWAGLASDAVWVPPVLAGVLWPATAIVLLAKAGIEWRASRIKGK